MIQAVIFDMGGVLAQDVWEHMYLDPEVGLASRFSLDGAELYKIGLLLWESFAYIPEIPPNGWRELEFRYWKQFLHFYGERIPQSVRDSGPQLLIEDTARFIVPVPGVETELQRLQERGIALAMCSDNNEFWFRRQMDTCRLHRFFSPDKVALSCRVGVSKGSPRFEMFHTAMKALGTAASNCLFIDDRQNNVDRAKAFGMDALLFTSADKLGSDLRQRGL
jgi:HAD superfamily hydrolase (TIGR01509 family)